MGIEGAPTLSPQPGAWCPGTPAAAGAGDILPNTSTLLSCAARIHAHFSEFAV